mmetsp:Transcript_59378/g.142495  ORF Transcript_59378/g.142495 Transcript_59378/m.142495 type:complete len:526 (-) Transcript_59378:1197-2774(-)
MHTIAHEPKKMLNEKQQQQWFRYTAFWCIGVAATCATLSQHTRQSVGRATQPRLAAEALASEGELDLGEVPRRGVRLALCGAERGEHLEQLHNVAVVAQVRRGARRLAAHGAGEEVRVRGRGAEGVLQRLEHELVRGVVSDAEHEVERLRVAGEALPLALALARSAAAPRRARLLRGACVRLLELNDALGHDALVDALGAGLDVALARAHDHGEGGEHAAQRVLQLLALHLAELGVGVAEVEDDARALCLHVGAVRPVAVDVHDLARHLAPRVVHLGHELLPLAVAQPEVVAVLDAEREVGDGAECAEHLLARQPAHDHHVARRVGAQLAERVEHVGRQRVAVGVTLVEEALGVGGREGAAPVEQQHALWRALELLDDLGGVERLEAGAHAHEPELGVSESDADEVLVPLGRHGLELEQEALGEGLVSAAEDELEVLGRARLALLRPHHERRVEALDQLGLRVRVDAEAAVEHAREACELGEDERPGGQAAPVARQHKLERRHVDGLAQGRDGEHRRRAPQLQPL